MAVAGGHVIVAGSEGARDARTFRFSVATGEWRQPTTDGRLAVEAPLLLPVTGGAVLLIGGSGQDGALALRAYPRAGAMLWADARLSGTPPPRSSLAGGSSEDGTAAMVLALEPDGSASVYTLDVQAGRWSKAAVGADGPAARTGAGAVVVEAALAVFGGEGVHDGKRRGDVWLYRPAAQRPAWLANGTGPVHHLLSGLGPEHRFAVEGCGAAVGRLLYAFGGVDAVRGKAASASLRLLDVTAPDWLTLPVRGDEWPPPRYKCKAAADAANGMLYLFGGKRKTEVNGGELKTLYEDFWRYDVAAGTWTELESKSRGAGNAPAAQQNDASMVVAGGHVVLAGADSGEEGVAYRYHIASAKWIAPTLDSRLAVEKTLLVALPCGRVLMLGGEDPTEAPSLARGLVADAAAEQLQWANAGFSGDVPYGSGFVGGSTRDGGTVLVLAPQRDLTNAVHRLDVAAGVWTKLAVLSSVQPRIDAGGAVVDGALVIFGGEHAVSEQLLGDVWAYDPNASAPAQEPSNGAGVGTRNLTQAELSAANVKHFDGWDDYLSRKSAPWTKVSQNSVFARGAVNTAVIGSRCYFYGGQDSVAGANKFGSDVMFIFDFETFEFTLVPKSEPWPPPTKSSYLAADCHRGLVYLYGGNNDLLTKFERTQLWVFDTRTERWRQLYQPEHTVNVNDPCAAGGPKEPFAPLVGSADDGSLVSTRDRLIVAGNDKAADTFARVFDKATERWLEPIPVDQRLRSEDPGFVSFGADECCGIWISGQDDKGALRSHVVLVNTSVPGGWSVEDLVSEGGIEAEEALNVAVDGGFVVMGQPSGQGPLASTSQVARFLMSERRYVVVNQSSQCIPASMCLQQEEWWLPVRTEAAAAAYRNHLFVFGGVAVDAAPFGDVWVYDLDRCPQDCNGRGTCVYGNCEDCLQSFGIACEVPAPKPGSTVPFEWVGPVIGVVVVVLAGLFWVLDAENRKKRRLYNINRVALQSAEAIARLALDEHLAFLEQIEHPSQLQSAFVNIIRIMVLWRSYIPQSVLHSVGDGEEVGDDAGTHAVRRSSSRDERGSNSFTPSSGPAAGPAGQPGAADIGRLHREAKEAVALGLQRKRVAAALLQLVDVTLIDLNQHSQRILRLYESMMTWLPEVDKKVAVSSCVADEVLVTWGAFSPCSDVSSKVLNLALALRRSDAATPSRFVPTSPASQPEVALCSPVAPNPLSSSGRAEFFVRPDVRLAGTRGSLFTGYVGSESQRFPQVLGTAVQLLRPLLEVGEESCADAVVDWRLREDCQGKAVMRPIAVVRMRAGSLVTAIQVVGPIDQGEEWMYNLERCLVAQQSWEKMWSVFCSPVGADPLAALPLLQQEAAKDPGDQTVAALLELWRSEGRTGLRNWHRFLCAQQDTLASRGS
eukprot:TRINITY_DN10402_c0_g1_i5.p1 TRINITY_DN10402_c0_g1~~TRINITY_DN10402_c0_g1_i5.p1  ORF type:complete len:1563 (+),score=506.02 TRINITY_DN10402_c0_g1_i5:513-4691(+)